MSKKDNQQSNEQQVLIPVIVDIESVKEHGRIAGMEKYKITKSRVCNRKLNVILVPGSKSQYDTIMSDYSREFKAEDRDKRCAVPGEDGKLIRCPESRKCSECTYYLKREEYGTALFSDLSVEGDDGETMEYDPAAPENYNDGDRYLRMLKGLIEYASAKDPNFRLMIELLLDGKSRRQIAEELGIPKSTVIDRVAKLRKIADEFLENLTF